MKKGIAVITATIVLLSSLVFGVCAEGFTFREVSRQWAGNTLSVAWNASEAGADVQIEDVLIGGKSYADKLTLDASSNLMVDLSALPAGIYPSVTYAYITANGQGVVTSSVPLIKAGIVTVSLSAAVNADGALTVTATDANGAPVAGYNLKLTIGNMSNISGKTDTSGKYQSPYTAKEGSSAIYEGLLTENQGVQYAAVAAATIVRPVTATTTVVSTTATTWKEETTTVEETTTTEEETTTTVETTAPSTSFLETLVTVQGAGTSSKENKRIALNVSTDTGILGMFKLKRADFDNNARLFLSEENYAAMVGRTSNVLMLNVLSVEKQTAHDTVQEAIKSSSFASRSDEKWIPMTFNLSLLMLDRSGKTVPVTAAPQDAEYTVTLPLPASLKDCSEWAITTFDGETLMKPQPLAVENGCFTLQTNSMGEYVVIGFPSDSGNKAGSTSWWLVLLLVIGILLLIGAGALLYFFIFRAPDAGKKKQEIPEQEVQPLIRVEPESESDIFSGRTDIDITNKTIENDEQE
ncbi:MAG: Ig-like domain-containing protein [Clostridia bacterium]|nr:Ig-like domain-containing protein [Clostridia bacterium]